MESLFFLNPRQYRVRDGIIDAVRQFGSPRLEEHDGNLYLRLGNSDAQTVYAYDEDRPGGHPIGLVVFLRSSPAEIVIVHLAVLPDYALRGRRAGLGLGLTLVAKVKEIASRIVGIEKVLFFYQPDVVIKL